MNLVKKEPFTLWIERPLLRRLRLEGVRRGLRLNQMIEQALRAWLAESKVKPANGAHKEKS